MVYSGFEGIDELGRHRFIGSSKRVVKIILRLYTIQSNYLPFHLKSPCSRTSFLKILSFQSDPGYPMSQPLKEIMDIPGLSVPSLGLPGRMRS